MKLRFRLLAIAGAIFMLNSVFCKEPYILYICDLTYDSGFTEVLENAGYNVVLKISDYRGILDAGELDLANNASLIIMSRNCSSGEYGGTEALAAQWNGISTPLIDLSVFSTRDSRWQWFNTSNVVCAGDTLTVPASAASHPLYKGIETSGELPIYTGTGSDYIYINNAGNGKVLAYNSDQTGIFIAEWDAGKPFYDGSAYTPAGKRVFFAAGRSDCGSAEGETVSVYNLNATGKTMFLNIVDYMIPDATIYKFPDGSEPDIDGQIDPLWTYVDAHVLKLSDSYCCVDNNPTLNVASWRAAWNDNEVFVIISVNDDNFYPHYEAGSSLHWEYDRAEIYFDLNVGELDDGIGPITPNSGHIQIAEPFSEGQNPYITDYITWNGYFVRLGYLVSDPNYVCEYAIDISYLLDKYNNALDPSTEPVIGFEVNVVDRDEGDTGKRIAVWSNTGENGGSWDNMDDCGEVRFSNNTIDKPDATFYRFPEGCAPTIDGTADPLWNNVEVHNISRTFRTEEPTLNLATWQAAWNDTSIFILVTVEDDDFYPLWESGDVEWMSDKTEIYFDVNDELKDEGGPQNTAGHYQIAPPFIDEKNEDSYTDYYYPGPGPKNNIYLTYAYKVNDPDYVYEYALNIEDFNNIDEVSLNPNNMDMIGFDVTIVDRDDDGELRKRGVWKNTGALYESWYNMDDCGVVEFSTEEIEVEIPAVSITPSISSDKYTICSGETVQLQTTCTDCGGAALTYSWNSVPTGFTSALGNPKVSPDISTTYTVNVSDGYNSGSTSVNITVLPSPDKPEIKLKGENILICIDSGMFSYQWYYYDQLLTGETKQFYKINTDYPGNYFVQTSYGTQCKTMSDAINFAAKSARTEPGEPIIEVFPVPNTGNFTLSIKGEESGRAIINIRDYTGTIIKNLVVDKDSGPLYEEISIANIPKGLYIMDIMFNNVIFYRRLLIN
jgi:hypothetical protein